MNNITFHIGLHKTATTWLQQVFYPQHTHMHNIINSAAPWKDKLIFDLVKAPEKKFDPNEWREQYKKRITKMGLQMGDSIILSAERLSGHPANGGIDRFRMAHRIHKAAPQGKILCVFRNQTHMIPSLYRTMVNEGFTGTINDLLVDRSWKTAGTHPVYFEYDLLVKEYQALFGKEACLFLCYEHMLTEPEDFLKRICNFIGVDPVIPESNILNRKVNTGFPKRGLGFFRRLNAYRKSEYNPHISLTVPMAMYKSIVKCYRRVKQPKTVLSADQVAAIQSLYTGSNNRLVPLLDETMARYVASYTA